MRDRAGARRPGDVVAQRAAHARGSRGGAGAPARAARGRGAGSGRRAVRRRRARGDAGGAARRSRAATPDYVSVADPDTLAELDDVAGPGAAVARRADRRGPPHRQRAGALTATGPDVEAFFAGIPSGSRSTRGWSSSSPRSARPAIRVTKSQVAYRRRVAFAWTWLPARGCATPRGSSSSRSRSRCERSVAPLEGGRAPDATPVDAPPGGPRRRRARQTRWAPGSPRPGALPADLRGRPSVPRPATRAAGGAAGYAPGHGRRRRGHAARSPPRPSRPRPRRSPHRPGTPPTARRSRPPVRP